MIHEVPGWQSDYIGGKANTYDTFRWVTGPAAERVTFWCGLGVNGLPYLSGSRRRGDQASRTLFEYEPKPAFGGNRRLLLVQPTATTRASCSPTGPAERNIRPNVPRNTGVIHKARPFGLANANSHRACRARAWQSMTIGTSKEHGSRCRQRHRNATPRVNIPFAVIMSSSRNRKARSRSNLPIRSRLIWAGSENSAKAPAQQADKSL